MEIGCSMAVGVDTDVAEEVEWTKGRLLNFVLEGLMMVVFV